jgi:hypothetical protein
MESLLKINNRLVEIHLNLVPLYTMTLTIVVAGTEVGDKKSMDLLILPNSAIIDP